MSLPGERGWVGPVMNKFQQVSIDHHQMLLAGDGYVSSDDHQISPAEGGGGYIQKVARDQGWGGYV